MLTHRTNVLLTEDDNRMLEQLSREHKVTKSDLIRRAIKKTYSKYNAKKPKQTIDYDLYETIKGGWKRLKNPHDSLDYKELVEDGRK